MNSCATVLLGLHASTMLLHQSEVWSMFSVCVTVNNEIYKSISFGGKNL